MSETCVSPKKHTTLCFDFRLHDERCEILWSRLANMGLGAARQCDNLTRSRCIQLCSVTLGRRHFPHILLPFLLYPTLSPRMFHLMDDTTLLVVECGSVAQVWNNY